MVVIIVGREIAVSGLRLIAAAEGWVLEPSELGKTKMVSQVVAITVIALERRYPAVRPLGQVLLWMVVLFAVGSAVQYFWYFWKRLDERVKHRASRRLIVIRADEKEPEEKDVAAH
jgi:CDP-diacylglycerol--glycerol-3-phosphate 3-phosphatidyltransferase